MKISTKGRYALAIMFYLAKNYKSKRYISLKEIAENEDISFKYLEKIMINLNTDDYLDVLRGNNGGYRLNKDPRNYKIGDILRKAEGELTPVICLLNGGCEKMSKCYSYSFFVELNKEINSFVDKKTLADYIEEDK